MADSEVDDRLAIEQLMHRFLAAVSFATGGRPAYDALPGLFGPGAQLVRNSGSSPEISTVEQFVKSRQQAFDGGQLTSFQETEIADITELFGNVAHRFSTYTKRGTTEGAPIDARGAISTQLIRTPEGWRISSMAWDDERDGLSLPSRYVSG